MKNNEYSGAALAYLGDAALEVMVRQTLLETGITDIGKLNQMAGAYVRATSQSEAVERMLPLLTEEELAIYKRGRNTHTTTVPKSASPVQYRRATGMEALFGYLYLEKQTERMHTLFRAAFPGDDASES